MTGYLQQQIIKLGKEKGKVTNLDILKFYSQEKIQREMNKLIVLGYFKNPTDKITYVEWEYNGISKDNL
ncbi:hypothetical protein CCP1ISM_60017 [Azospirillaceae bacterium]